MRVTKPLVDAGADVNAVTWHKETPLHLAAVYNHERIVADLLDAGADPNLLDDSGRHPLFNTSSPRVAKMLMKAGTKVNLGDKYGYTPLAGAVTLKDKRSLVKCILDGGANVNKRIDHGRTAVFNAIPDDEVEIFKLLVEHGADLSVKSDSGETPLDWVKEYDAKKIKKFLNERKAKAGRSPSSAPSRSPGD
jgi:ankyrin repeat protein